MTNDEARQYLQLQQDAENTLDARVERIADRAWRSADQTINGTARSFLMEAALIQRLPFQPAGAASDGTDNRTTGRTTA